MIEEENLPLLQTIPTTIKGENNKLKLKKPISVEEENQNREKRYTEKYKNRKSTGTS